MRTSRLLALTALTLWALLAPAYGQLARSTFDVDAEGWMIVDRVPNSLEVIQTRAPQWALGGFHERYIYATNGPGEFYFRASAEFLGNQSLAYGYSLEYDLQPYVIDAPTQCVYSVILIGGGMTHGITLPPLYSGWNHFAVPLYADAGWTNVATGMASSSNELWTCLSAVQSLDIAGKFSTNPLFNCAIDNVLLIAPPHTVVWRRQADGRLFWVCEHGTHFCWPDNHSWSQDELWGSVCGYTGMLEPSNWTTTNCPNDATWDVIIGNSGVAPAYALLDASVILHSLTLRPEGYLGFNPGLGMAYLTADRFDLQRDGVISGLGNNSHLRVAQGGILVKSGGEGNMVIEPCFYSYSGSVQVNRGTLTLAGPATINGLWTGSGDGVLAYSGYSTNRLQAGQPGATLAFPGHLFHWTGGWFGWDAPITNTGTVTASGPGMKLRHAGTICG